MKKFCLMVATAVALFSCDPAKKNPNAEAKKEIDPKILISCEGIGEVKLTDSREDLVKKFGDKKVVDHENNLYGVFTTVWYEDPKQINIYWKEKHAPFKTIKYIEAIKSDAPYMTKDSIQLGQSLRDLVKINGSISIKFRNISQVESPGLITNFNGGNIEKNNPCFSGLVEQAKLEVIHKDELKAFQKQEEVNSYDPLLNRMTFELSAIRIKAKQ